MHENTWQLPATLRVQDVTQELQRLRAVFDSGRPVTLDVSALVTVDTAGVQLLLAIVREGMRQGIPVGLRGESGALVTALRLLGLPAAWPACVTP
jgi:ABC-type transporter Mla MlaB component